MEKKRRCIYWAFHHIQLN